MSPFGWYEHEEIGWQGVCDVDVDVIEERECGGIEAMIGVFDGIDEEGDGFEIAELEDIGEEVGDRFETGGLDDQCL
jgi:hypothetical protein